MVFTIISFNSYGFKSSSNDRFINYFYNSESINGDNLKYDEVNINRPMVDTDLALSIMRKKIQAHNLPYHNELEKLQDSLFLQHSNVETINNRIRSISDVYIISLEPKIKDKESIELIEKYLIDLLSYIPQDSILAYCKEKEVVKAKNSLNRSTDIDNLITKFKKQLFKKTEKGDFSSGFVRNAFKWDLDRLRVAIKRQQTTIEETESKMEEILNSIQKVPKSFDKNRWYEVMGNMELPITTVSEKSKDFTGLTYSQMVDRYYHTPDLKESFEKELTAEGRFDGEILDRLSVYPLESSLKPREYSYETWKRYGKLILMSEKATVPPLILESKEDFIVDNEYGISQCVNFIQKINTYWNGNEYAKDGLLVSFHPFESTRSEEYTFVLEDGRWKNITPLDAKYMSFEDCLEYCKKNAIKADIGVLNCKDGGEGYEEFTDLRILPFSNSNLKINEKTSNDNDIIYFKSDQNIADLEVPAKGYIGYFVQKNYWGNNDDAIIVYYEDNKMGKTVDKSCDIYRLVWSGPDGYSLNDTEYNILVAWIKRGEGKYDPATDKYKVRFIESEYY